MKIQIRLVIPQLTYKSHKVKENQSKFREFLKKFQQHILELQISKTYKRKKQNHNYKYYQKVILSS